MTGPRPADHGPLYYIARNLTRKLRAHRLGRALLVGVPVTLLAGIVLARPLAGPYLVALRRQSPAFVTAALATLALVLAWTRGGRRARALVTGGVTLLGAGILAYPGDFFRDLSLYGCWRSLERRELSRLPLTRHERIYPLSLVSRIVEDRVTESHFAVSPFEMQLRDGELYWVAQKTPTGRVNEVTLRDVTGLVQVAASSVDVEIRHHAVDFPYGRDLMLPKDLGRFVLPRELGWLDGFDKELDVEDLSFHQDERGEWVMVMAVIDWDGIFPYCVPRFGGVFVCPQRGKGDVRWLAPAEIAAVPWLREQNLVPEAISQFYAESWKFNRGLLGWIQNEGVTKITSIPEDTAQQPFAVYFSDVEGHDGVYQFFALEPHGKSAGLSKMLLVDPRGHQATPPVFVYDFEARGEELVGPARIAETIKASDIHVDWRQRTGGTFVIAESRPYIKDVAGTRRFRWFNSLVTRAQGSGQPRVVLADPVDLSVAWLEPGEVQALLEVPAPAHASGYTGPILAP